MRRILNSRRAFVLLLPIVASLYVTILLATTQSADAFVTVAKWANGRKTIYWNTRFTCTGGNGEFPASMRCEIRGGAYQWDNVNTGSSFNIGECNSSTTCSQAWVTSNDFSVPGWGDGPALVIHQWSGSSVTGADEYFNTDWNWNDETDGTCVINWNAKVADVRPIHNHEVGHWIVLDENGGNTDAERNALMHADLRCKLNTNSDDDAGVRHLYP